MIRITILHTIKTTVKMLLNISIYILMDEIQL